MCYNNENIESYINFDIFTKLLKEDISTSYNSNSIGLLFESTLINSQMLRVLEQFIIKEGKSLTLFFDASHLSKMNDLNTMLFENILLKLLMTSENKNLQDKVVTVLSSLDYIETILDNDIKYTIDSFMEDISQNNIVIFIDGLHNCDYKAICNIEKMIAFYKMENITFILSSDMYLLKHTVISYFNESCSNDVEEFYRNLFDKQYTIPTQLYSAINIEYNQLFFQDYR